MIRTEEILDRIRRAIAEENAAPGTAPASSIDDDGLPAIASRAELEYLNRNFALFDPASPMQSHRPVLGGLVVRLRWRLRHLVLGVLDRYFEKERLFLLELVRFANALAERSDRLLREVTERTRAVAERNDLFLGALDVRVEALEAREQMRRALAADPAPERSPGESSALLAEMASALEGDVAERIRPFVARAGLGGTVLIVGCGAGGVFAALPPQAAVSGSDVSADLVARCLDRGYAAEVAGAEAYLRSREESSVDAVVLTAFTDRHALAAWPVLVAAVWRALRPGGSALFCGLRGAVDLARLRWLLARQRFAIVEAEAVASPDGGDLEHVVVARRGEDG